jgi:hypothetical protein
LRAVSAPDPPLFDVDLAAANERELAVRRPRRLYARPAALYPVPDDVQRLTFDAEGEQRPLVARAAAAGDEQREQQGMDDPPTSFSHV